MVQRYKGMYGYIPVCRKTWNYWCKNTGRLLWQGAFLSSASLMTLTVEDITPIFNINRNSGYPVLGSVIYLTYLRFYGTHVYRCWCHVRSICQFSLRLLSWLWTICKFSLGLLLWLLLCVGLRFRRRWCNFKLRWLQAWLKLQSNWLFLRLY